MAIVGISFPCHVYSSPALAFCLSLSCPELGGIRMQAHMKIKDPLIGGRT